jgi:hypothetical protein
MLKAFCQKAFCCLGVTGSQTLPGQPGLKIGQGMAKECWSGPGKKAEK